jgi:hypothetical protein
LDLDSLLACKQQGGEMKNKVISRPAKSEDFNFEVMYIEISDAWERRAKELQSRRWAKLRQKERLGDPHDRRSPS